MESNTIYGAADCPVSIGFGQTISQPTLVLNMTLKLDLEPDSRVLEIGTGSGYQTALLGAFSYEVYTVERLEPLYDKAKKRLDAKGFTNIHFKHGDGSLGWPEHQPYDRIIVTASVSRVPDELLDQLDAGGRMIIPVGNNFQQELQMVEKDDNGDVTFSVLEDVAFVRLKGKYE
ncbi:protein-L-isoaspartate(D-aspartate) O-methyltransferase [Lentibacillus amyloliquefaciens]|uniref:Protein-L-isoaspartate O-methyltransferase n=2 Tax=Lentibacillus amyloliquefaciens TaxID=1472767 RepID=A0A0U3NVT2_9BACI|nr:protein-L-isoaspartate(D-aspartate) O-methyltransferase [Lentibacillus amyloliquefaciens]